MLASKPTFRKVDFGMCKLVNREERQCSHSMILPSDNNSDNLKKGRKVKLFLKTTAGKNFKIIE